MKQFPFSACHSEIPPDEFVHRCERDTCACNMGGDCECLCTALAAYVHECAARGVAIKWRSQELCRKYSRYYVNKNKIHTLNHVTLI